MGLEFCKYGGCGDPKLYLFVLLGWLISYVFFFSARQKQNVRKTIHNSFVFGLVFVNLLDPLIQMVRGLSRGTCTCCDVVGCFIFCLFLCPLTLGSLFLSFFLPALIGGILIALLSMPPMFYWFWYVYRYLLKERNSTSTSGSSVKTVEKLYRIFCFDERVEVKFDGRWRSGIFHRYRARTRDVQAYGVQCDNDKQGVITWAWSAANIRKLCVFNPGARVQVKYQGSWYGGTFEQFRPNALRSYGVHCDVDAQGVLTWAKLDNIQQSKPRAGNLKWDSDAKEWRPADTIANVFQSQPLPSAVALPPKSVSIEMTAG